MAKFSKYLKGAAQGTGKAASKVNNTVGNTIDKVVMDPLASATIWGAKKMTKKTDPGIQNLWTGRRESKTAIVAGSTVAAGYMGYSTFKQTELAPRTGAISYAGAAPNMDADGVASTSKAPTLGANGNMVFGLHESRKG